MLLTMKTVQEIFGLDEFAVYVAGTAGLVVKQEKDGVRVQCIVVSPLSCLCAKLQLWQPRENALTCLSQSLCGLQKSDYGEEELGRIIEVAQLGKEFDQVWSRLLAHKMIFA